MTSITFSPQGITLRAVAVLAAVFLGLFGAAVPAHAGPEEYCLPQVERLREVKSKAAVHNAKPHVFQLPRQQAALDAYNKEAADLRAAGDKAIAAAKACLDAMQALAAEDDSGMLLNPPPATRKQAIADAVKALPAGWVPGPKPAPGKPWRAPKDPAGRKFYDTLRDANPGDPGDVKLRGQPRPKPGDPDPAYPGQTIQATGPGKPMVSGDHIIPLTEIMQMPGFMRLTPQNMYAVSRAPINLQWLSWSANLSKSSRSAAAMKRVDPGWQAQQVKLENELRPRLAELIQKLLASQ